jgi:hypothetical protein
VAKVLMPLKLKIVIISSPQMSKEKHQYRVHPNTPGVYVYKPFSTGGAFKRVLTRLKKTEKKQPPDNIYIQLMENIINPDYFKDEIEAELMCDEDADEIFEDIDMEENLDKISIIPHTPIYTNIDYGRFQLWGTKCEDSISQLY